jgi:hypothetical protein
MASVVLQIPGLAGIASGRSPGSGDLEEAAMRGIRSVLLVPILLGLSALLFTATADEQAVITLGVLPMPPDCVQNPGGTATITWSIVHQTAPDRVVFTLYDPTHTIIYDQETYPGGTGLAIERTWTVPSPLPSGMYWVRVEYYAQGIGLEAWAETGFMLCRPIGVCCVDEQCFVMQETECLALGGVFHPEWDSCGPPNPCARPHVCCVGEDCYLVLEEECAALGGAFHPEWDSCGPPNPCALPHVCCVGEDCYVVLEEECAALGGAFHPEWDSCGPPNPCAATPAAPDTWGAVKELFR